jgi:hypothetical protein
MLQRAELGSSPSQVLGQGVTASIASPREGLLSGAPFDDSFWSLPGMSNA